MVDESIEKVGDNQVLQRRFIDLFDSEKNMGINTSVLSKSFLLVA